MNADGPGSTRSHRLIGLVLLLIVYGSLYPLTWNFAAPQPFVWRGAIGVLDLIENVVLFFPLGGVLGWSSQERRRDAAHLLFWAVIALVLASALQWLQRYLPRTPALSDVIFNMVGYALGAGAGVVSRRHFEPLLIEHRNFKVADRLALVLVALWLLAELYPLIPTLDVSSVKDNLKSLWQQDLWQPRRMSIHAGMTVIGLSAVAQFARSAHLAHRARQAALIAVLAVLAGKFLVVGQAPGLAVVGGIAAGAVLWRLLDRSPGLQWASMAAAGLATYLIAAIWPWAWRAAPVDMGWMPFASSLSTSIHSSLPARALECLCFGAILWGTVRSGAALGRVTFCTALLALACEWTQRYLPTRTPEITPVLLALAMGWLVSACNVPRQATTARPFNASRHRAGA